MRFGILPILAVVFVGPILAAERPHFAPLLDTSGAIHRLGEKPNSKAVAVVFLSPECPLCQRYIPALNKLAEGSPAGTEFYGVVSNAAISFVDAAKFAKDYGLKFPLLFDGSAALAAHFKPTHVPEAFVLNGELKLKYRGRIDDWYEKPGKPRAETKSHDLKDALAAIASGKAIGVAKTEPVGCLFEDAIPKLGEAPAQVNYNRHIAAILASRCAHCHRPDEVAPFPLLNFNQASKKAKQIARVVSDRAMPPWKAERGYGHFRDEQHLTKAEIATLVAWAETGATEGAAADLPPATKFPEGWQLGKPDLILKMPEAYKLAADGKDVIRNFVIPMNLKQNELVTAMEVRPGNRKIVHHVIAVLDASGRARKLDAEDEGPGYASAKGGVGFIPTGGLGGWAPGVVPRHVPDGMGRYCAKGSDLVLQVHYHPSGKAESDQSEIGIYFLKKPATHYLGGLAVENWTFSMPPDEKNFKMKAEYELPANAIFTGVAPHMHLLGKEMKAWAETPDGKTVPLISVKNWDFNWQDFYLYREPIRLPKGTKLKMESVHDNSSDNPANPNRPSKKITWGEGTADEMSLCLFEFTCDSIADLLLTVTANAIENKIVERFAEPPKK